MMTNDNLDTDVFVPEKFVMHKELLIRLPNFGWGIRLPAKQLASAIREGRIHPNVILNNAVVGILNETAVERV